MNCFWFNQHFRNSCKWTHVDLIVFLLTCCELAGEARFLTVEYAVQRNLQRKRSSHKQLANESFAFFYKTPNKF